MRAAVIALLLASTVARADDRAAAERAFRAGSKAYAAQNFAAAAQNFDEAYKAMPIPEIAFSAAQAYRRLYRVDPQPEYVKKSVDLYRAYLAVVKSGGRVGDAADSLGEMERELDKLQKAGAQLTASAPAVEHTRLGVSVVLVDQTAAQTTTLKEIGDAIGETTKGLAVTIDGKPVEPFALVDVDAKEHVVAASADGYFPVEKKAVAVPGQSFFVDVELRPRPAKVAVATLAGARIVIDGRTVSTAPTAPLDLEPGKHLLAILHRGREPFGKELVVGRGEAVKLDAPLEKTARRRAVPWVLGGAGVLAGLATTSAILALVHDGHASDTLDAIRKTGDQDPGQADYYDGQVRARDHAVTATWILGGGALAAGSVGLLLYLFDNPSAEGVKLAPAVDAGSAGAVVSGRF